MTQTSDKFAHLPETLAALLRKLADHQYSVRDASSERLDWVRAGCPVPEPRDEWADYDPKHDMGQ